MGNSSIPTDKEKKILDSIQKRHRYAIEQKFDLIEPLLDDDLKMIHVTGQEVSKSRWLEDMRSKDYVYHKIDVNAVSIQISGDTADVLEKATYVVSILGSKGRYNLSCKETYQKVGQVWKLTFTKASLY